MVASTQDRIELGQDMNNTWAVVAARIQKSEYSPSAEDIDRWFAELFPVVRARNCEARYELQDTGKVTQ